MIPAQNVSAVEHIHFVLYQRLFKNNNQGYLTIIRLTEKVASLPSSFQTILHIFNLIGWSNISQKSNRIKCDMRQNIRELNERGNHVK